MEYSTYIVEAEALIENVHEIKQWVYDGYIRLLVPLCTLEQVESSSKAVTTQKEAQKDTTTGRPSGRAARKEQPLFDINPRTSWEFLLRAKSEKGEEGVKLQKENEEFTQWKEEDEKAAEKEKAAVTPTAPISFADALLRKLNMKDESDSDSSKAPPKPRLVPRSNEPKSPWKYHKIPTVSSRGIPPAFKPLYSYALWRVYEVEKNPLQQETVTLLVKSKAAQIAAEKLGIPTTLITDIRSSVYAAKSKNDDRLRVGELEVVFPESVTSPATNGTAHKTEQSVNGYSELASNEAGNAAEKSEETVELAEEKSKVESTQTLNSDDVAQKAEGTAVNGTQIATDYAPAIQVKSPWKSLHEEVSQVTAPAASNSHLEKSAPITKPSSTNGENGLSTPVQLSRPSTASGEKKGEESELDSDEEIIVFNPRARRTSGRKQKDAQRSRPNTSGGQPPKILKSLPKETIANPSSSYTNGTTPNDITRDLKNIVEAIESIAASIEKPAAAAAEKLRPKIESSLKAESPVFTPGKPFIPNSQPPKLEPRPTPPPATEPVKSSPPKSPAIPTNPRSIAPRQPRIAMQQRNASQEHLRQTRENQQRESERMIQRQREAIQRRARVIEKAPKKTEEKVEEVAIEKPPPRQIQMEPTNNPTVIDPDAFDRSYVVQPSTSSPNATNSSAEKRRPRGNQTHTRGNGIKMSQGSPRRKETPEPEVEYVLKSGAPRGSVRGKGKLWIP